MLHLDSAADGSMSPSTIQAVAAHLEAEAARGAYVVEAEVMAPGGAVDRLASEMAGALGTRRDRVIFTESATASLRVLLQLWHLAPGARVAVVPSEWGPNLDQFAAAGLEIDFLPADDVGAVDLEALPAFLEDRRPDVIHLTQVAAHRGLVQPVTEAAALARERGVPVWADLAQGLGHVMPPAEVDAAYGTSRKWLRGPRGVGLLVLATEPPGGIRRLPGASGPMDPLTTWQSHEANVAGRVGLASAAAGVVTDRERFGALADLGRLTRGVLSEVPGWRTQPTHEHDACATTAIHPTAGQDVAAVRGQLLDRHKILTTATAAWRAPHEAPELGAPSLRVSPHLHVTEADLEALAAALAECH